MIIVNTGTYKRESLTILYTCTYIAIDSTMLVYKHSVTLGNTSIHASLSIKSLTSLPGHTSIHICHNFGEYMYTGTSRHNINYI